MIDSKYHMVRKIKLVEIKVSKIDLLRYISLVKPIDLKLQLRVLSHKIMQILLNKN